MWENVKKTTTGILQWVKKNLLFCGGVLVSVLLSLLMFYKRKASTLENQLETVEKRQEVKEAHQETEKAETDYEKQHKTFEEALADYNAKYHSKPDGDGGK